MRYVYLTLPHPHESVKNPSRGQIVHALMGDPPNHGLVGEVWIILRDSEEKGFYRRLWFYLRPQDSDEMIAFFERNGQSDWMVTLGDDERNEVFLAEDTGGRDWKLNTKFIVSVQKGIECAQELVDTGEIQMEDNWTVLPEV